MSKIRTYIRWGFIITGLIILIVVFFRFKDYILPVLAVIGGALGYVFGKRTPKDQDAQPDRKKEQEAYRTIDTVKEQAAATDEKEQNLEQRIDSLKEQVKKRRSGGSKVNLLFPVIIFLMAGTVWAAQDNLYIPTDYNELRKLYIEADQQVLEALDIIEAQQKEIAELRGQRDEVIQAAETLKEVCLEKDKTIADHAARLERLNHQWGFFVGGQDEQGLNFGLSRRFDSFSFGVGLSTQGDIYGNCTFWF